MPFTKIMIHFIWATKNRERIISNQLKPLLLAHIKDNSMKKQIYIDCMNCVEDHIHILVSLSADQTIAKVMQLIKGESSFWVNQQNLVKGKFEWQDDYIALSVSQSAVNKVRAYIANQEEHHKKKTFENEYQDFLTAHGFDLLISAKA